MRTVLIAFAVVVFAGSSRGGPPDPQALADRIDRHLAAKWGTVVRPTPVADDAEFLRRAYLDITGRIPRPRDVYDFLADRDPDKRAKLIDELLDTPRYAAHFADVWRAVLLPEAAANGEARTFQPGFEAWLTLRLRANVGYDRLVRELIAVPISTDAQAPQPVLQAPDRPNPLAFIAAKEAKPENLAAATARVFLGIQIECAQCHDHPFAKWTRDQFWSQAGFFAGVERQGDGLFAPVSEDPAKREATPPNSKRKIAAEFLDGTTPADGPGTNPRTALAAWVTARDNPYFARAAANRVWGHFFGFGIVHPVDDFHDQNPPSHPELLDDLARSFAESGFDQKFLIRAICRTEAYRRSSARTDTAGPDDPRLFARGPVKGLTGEQFFDSLALVTGYHERAGGRGRAPAREQFLTRFTPQGRPGEPETSVPQALTLMNGRFVADATGPASEGTITAVAGIPGLDTAARIEALYVAALSRPPTVAERDRMIRFVDDAGPDRRSDRLADVFWVLLNSVEFRLNH